MLGAIFKITKPGHVVVALLFVGVPTTVSLSRFLPLIRVRLLGDPERTNSPHFEKITWMFHPAIILTGGCFQLYVTILNMVAIHDWDLIIKWMIVISTHTKSNENVDVIRHMGALTRLILQLLLKRLINNVTHCRVKWTRLQTPVKRKWCLQKKNYRPTAQNTKHLLLLPSTGATMNSSLHVKVSSYVHFICKSSLEEELRHRF